jgi:hypothetical protein
VRELLVLRQEPQPEANDRDRGGERQQPGDGVGGARFHREDRGGAFLPLRQGLALSERSESKGRRESHFVGVVSGRQITTRETVPQVGGKLLPDVTVNQVIFDGLEALEKIRVHDTPFVERICLNRREFPQKITHEYFVGRCRE